MLNLRNTYKRLNLFKDIFAVSPFGSGNTRQFFLELSNGGTAIFF